METETLSLLLGSIGGGLGYAIGQVVQFFFGRRAQKAALARDEQNAYAEMARQDNETILSLHTRLRKLERAVYLASRCKFAYQCPTLKEIDNERRSNHYPRDETLNADKESSDSADDDPPSIFQQ